MPHIYKVKGRGMALGAQSVVLAENRNAAIRLHIRAVNAQTVKAYEESADLIGSESIDSTKIQQKDVTLRVHGKLVTEFVFFVWNGDY